MGVGLRRSAFGLGCAPDGGRSADTLAGAGARYEAAAAVRRRLGSAVELEAAGT